MGGPLDTWRVHGGFDEVEVEIDPGRVDLDAMQTSIRELTKLLDGVGYPSETRQTLLEIHARLHGLPSITRRIEVGRWFALGSPHARVLADDLLGAARTGRLVVRRLPRPRWLAAAADSEPPISKLRPIPPPPAPQKSWIGVALVDQNGKPVPDRGYRVVTVDGAVYQDTLAADGTAKVKDILDGPCRLSCPYRPPRGALTYTVQPGDHISGIAQTYGFDDYTNVWNDPKNAQLASQRSNPHELVEGDQVFIPPMRDVPVTKATGEQYTFAIQISPLKIRVKVLGLDLRPVAGASCTLDGAMLATDGDGVVEAPVDKLARASFLSVQGADLALQLGRLAPLDDDSDAGWKARLFNLGFLLDPEAEEGDAELRIALEDFQAQYGLQVTGELDDATKAQLQDSHGC